MKHRIFLLLWLWLIGCTLPAFAADNTDAPYQLMLADIEVAVSDALSAAKVAEHVKASVTSTREKMLYAGERPAHVELKTLRYQSDKKTWSANMLVMDGETVITARPIAGRYTEQQGLPVLKRRVLEGGIITEQDIATQFFPLTKIRQDTITMAESLIGKTPRHMVSANRPIREAELTTPAVMKKGSVITMQYRTPYMNITTMGEAQEDGSVGDFIRVRNPDSGKIIRARIVSAQEVLAGNGGGE
jgi:flagellar basal body P-ring formation protein FlgA